MSTTNDQARRIAERMRYYRRRAGLSQEDVAHNLGVTVRTYARWERGETLGHLSRVAEVAAAMKATPEELAPADEVVDVTQPVRGADVEAKLDRVIELLEGLYGNEQARAAIVAALADEED